MRNKGSIIDREKAPNSVRRNALTEETKVASLKYKGGCSQNLQCGRFPLLYYLEGDSEVIMFSLLMNNLFFCM